MDRRAVMVVLVGLLVVLSGCAQLGSDVSTNPEPSTNTPQATAATTTASDETTTARATTTSSTTTDETTTDGDPVISPPDPPTDRLGWENGFWYNETLPITEDDGLNQSELEAVVNRAMARVEYLRGLEFNRSVPVSVVSRETYREEYAESSNESAALETFDNVKFELLFLVGEKEDSLAVQKENRGSNVLGFYSPKDDQIVIVSESETPRVTETTLGHELVHALQFGHFNTSEFNSSTRELHNARNGIIEGDARYLDARYDEKCGIEWTCTTQAPGEGDGGGDGGSDLHLGIYIMKYFPYSDGPGLVDHEYQRGGWDAVNAIYSNPPESAEQVANPAKYLQDHPTDVDLPDESSSDWSKVTPADRAPYGSVGQASITAMLVYPAYDDTRSGNPVVGPQEFLNLNEDGSVDSADPIVYNVSYTEGWDGDKLWVYENAAGETAYTWRIVWDTEEDAAEFAAGYRRLLTYWGGDARDGEGNLWRIPEGESEFADAFYLDVEGDTVTIVNAPTIDDLSAVHADAPSS